MLSNYLAAIAALASAFAAWLVYRRDWTVKHDVLEPECYWIGYQLASSQSPFPKPAFAFPLHLVNRRGTGSVQGDLVIKIRHVDSGSAIWLEPEFMLRSDHALGTDWTGRQLFRPISVGGRDSVSWIVIATYSGRNVASAVPDCFWQPGEYLVTAYDVKSESFLFETRFRQCETVQPDQEQLSIWVFRTDEETMDYGLRPREWTIPTLRARRRIMRMYRSA